jgi:hypothetical protein
MGDTRRALGLYADIIGQPEELDQLRKQRAAAMYLSMQCWTSDTEKKDELAVQEGEKFLQKIRGFEDRQPEWLTIRYYTALAAKKMADSFKDAKDENTKKTRSRRTSSRPWSAAGSLGTKCRPRPTTSRPRPR